MDLNLLLYACNRDAPNHSRARVWLEQALSDDEVVALPWAVILGFLRLVTNPRVFPRPLSPDQAIGIVDGWLSQPHVVPLVPGSEHWRILKDLLSGSGTAGNLTTDAHLAALAIEYGADLYSTDSDFARFPRVSLKNPLV
ncbi:MAG: ribonuclease VapC33 [Gemmatimonadales bacterium]|nr:Ribonuclease VapC33 [bacterium HR33]GIW53114.1 MAG: ribonuclease VapC33 [Gemmatimonadales bacterium]